MKKILILILLFIFSIQLSFAEENYKLTIKNKLIIHNISSKITKLIDTKGDIITSRYVTKLNKAIKNTEKNSRIYQILNSIKIE